MSEVRNNNASLLRAPSVPEIVPMMSEYIPPTSSLVGNYEKRKDKIKGKEFRKRSDSLKSQQSLWRLDPDTTGALPRDGYMTMDIYDTVIDPERQSRISYESNAYHNGISTTTTSASQSRRSSVKNDNISGISSGSSCTSSADSDNEYDMNHNKEKTSHRTSVISNVNHGSNVNTDVVFERQNDVSHISNGSSISQRNSVNGSVCGPSNISSQPSLIKELLSVDNRTEVTSKGETSVVTNKTTPASVGKAGLSKRVDRQTSGSYNNNIAPMLRQSGSFTMRSAYDTPIDRQTGNSRLDDVIPETSSSTYPEKDNTMKQNILFEATTSPAHQINDTKQIQNTPIRQFDKYNSDVQTNAVTVDNKQSVHSGSVESISNGYSSSSSGSSSSTVISLASQPQPPMQTSPLMDSNSFRSVSSRGSVLKAESSHNPSAHEYTTISRNTSHASSHNAPSLSSTLVRNNQSVDSCGSRSESTGRNSESESYLHLASTSPYVSRHSSNVSDNGTGSLVKKHASAVNSLTRKSSFGESANVNNMPIINSFLSKKSSISNDISSSISQGNKLMIPIDSGLVGSSSKIPSTTITVNSQQKVAGQKKLNSIVYQQDAMENIQKRQHLIINTKNKKIDLEHNDKPMSPKMEMEQIMKNRSTVSKLRIDFKNIPLTGRVIDPLTLERQKSKASPSPGGQKYKFLIEGIDTPVVENDTDMSPALPTEGPPIESTILTKSPPALPPGLLGDLNSSYKVTSPIKNKGFAYVMDSALSERIIKRAEDVTSRKPHEYIEEIHKNREEYNANQYNGEMSTLREARDKLKQKHESFEHNSRSSVVTTNIDISEQTENEYSHAHNVANNISTNERRNAAVDDIKQVKVTENTTAVYDTVTNATPISQLTTNRDTRNTLEKYRTSKEEMPGITKQCVLSPEINPTYTNDTVNMGQQMMSSMDDPGYITRQSAYSEVKSGERGQALYQAKQQFLTTQREGTDTRDNVTTVTKQDQQQFTSSYSTTTPIEHQQINNYISNNDPSGQHYQKFSQSQQQRTNRSPNSHGTTGYTDNIQQSLIERQRSRGGHSLRKSTSADGKLFIDTTSHNNNDYHYDEPLSDSVASSGAFDYYHGNYGKKYNTDTLQSNTTTSSFLDVRRPLTHNPKPGGKTRIVLLKPLTIEINDNTEFARQHAMKSYATYVSPGTLSEQPLSPRKITVLKQHQQERRQGKANIRVNAKHSQHQQHQRTSGDLESYQYQQNGRKSLKRHKGRHIAKIHLDGAVTDAYSDWEGASAYSEPVDQHNTAQYRGFLNREKNTKQSVYGGSQHIVSGDMVTSGVRTHDTGYDGISSVSQTENNMMDTRSIPVAPTPTTMLQPMLEDASQYDGNYHITLKLNQHAMNGGQPVNSSSSMRSQNSQWSGSMSIPDVDDGGKQNYRSHIRVDNSDSGSARSYNGLTSSKFVRQVQNTKPAFAMGINQTMTMDYAPPSQSQETTDTVHMMSTQQAMSPQQPLVQNTQNTYYNSSNRLQHHYYGNNSQNQTESKTRATSTQTKKVGPVRSVDDYFEDPEHRRRQKRKNKRHEYDEMANYFSPAEDDDYVNGPEGIPQLVTGSILIENTFDAKGMPVHMDLVGDDDNDDYNVEDNPNLYDKGYLQHRENPMYSSDEDVSRSRKSKSQRSKPLFNEVLEQPVTSERQKSKRQSPSRRASPPRYDNRGIHRHMEETFHAQKGLPNESDVIMDIPVGYHNGYDKSETIIHTTTKMPRSDRNIDYERTEYGKYHNRILTIILINLAF